MLASAIAGAMNAIAGGGTLLTFPALVGLGVAPIVANATSTLALVPGSFSSVMGYRAELAGVRTWAVRFALPGLLGGAVGAVLLLRTPAARFAHIVPYLVLSATTLFIVQKPLMAVLRRRRGGAAAVDAGEPVSRPPTASLLAYQFAVGVYGGYFGAGIGILMLAALGLLGFTNIHRMNGLKNWAGVFMNGIAALIFAFSSLVNWPVALTMAMGAVAGGYVGSRLAQRVPQRYVRAAIVVIGLGSGLWMLAT